MLRCRGGTQPQLGLTWWEQKRTLSLGSVRGLRHRGWVISSKEVPSE